MTTLANDIRDMASRAKIAARTLVTLSTEAKNSVLLHMATAIDKQRDFIQKENQKGSCSRQRKGLIRCHA